MQIQTSRFGAVTIEVDDILLFPRGLIGFEDCRHWVLLADEENPALGWLQSVGRGDVAMATLSPRRFWPDYRLRLDRGQLLPLELSHWDQAYVLALLSRSDRSLTVNLKAPVIVNLDRRLGRQVVASDDQPLALDLTPPAAMLRRAA
jgi:flagellar assembly factor FliW